MRYRREIDGLRALAVVPVILFHADIGGVPGGFVGVDVFFVISGYLITLLLIEDLDSGHLSLARFYERRARRILPALSVVLAVSLLTALIVLPPWELKDFAASLFSAVLSLSNFYFLSQTDYFAPAAEIRPLLHTWSLGVEEQYYLLFPPALALAWRFGRRPAFWMIVAVSLFSLALAEYGWRENAGRNFFFTGSRLWEIGAGSLCAMIVSRVGVRAQGAVAALGLAMILGAILLFSAATPFPSLYTLLPVLGTALFILFGHETTRSARLLSHPVPVHIGLISFSAYLWHQPLLAFARQLSGEDLSLGLRLILIAASLGLADLSWRWIETPFRRRPVPLLAHRRSVFLWSAVVIAGFAVPMLPIYLNHGFLRPLAPSESALLGYVTYPRDPVYRSGECLLLDFQSHDALAADCGQDRDRMILGDSHAAALFAGLVGDTAIGRITQGGCPPLFDFAAAPYANCAETNAMVRDTLVPRGLDQVYLHANWLMYAPLDGFDSALERTIETWQRAGTAVTLIGGVPQWQPSLPMQMVYQNRTLAEGARIDTDLADQRRLNIRLAQSARRAGVPFIDLLALTCDAQDRCTAVVPGETGTEQTLVAWDYAHLTRAGAEWLVARLRAAHPELF